MSNSYMDKEEKLKAAMERLIARIEETHNPDDPVPAWFDAARVALAEQQGRGPAVLESREPDSVADPDDPIQEALNKLEEYDQANPYHDCRDLIAAARVALARWRLSAAPPSPKAAPAGAAQSPRPPQRAG